MDLLLKNHIKILLVQISLSSMSETKAFVTSKEIPQKALNI